MKFSNDDSTVNLLQTVKSNIITTLHVAAIAIVTAINDNIYVCENISTGTVYDALCSSEIKPRVGNIVVVLFTDDNYLSDISVYEASGNYGNSSANEQYHNIINGIIIKEVTIYNNNLFTKANSIVIYNYITYTLSNDGTYYSVTACDTDATGDIVIYDSIGNIPVTNIADGSSRAGAFYNCTGITSITFGSEITSIGAYAFQSCTSLTELIIPDTITEINDHAFYQCTGLTSLIISENVESVGDSAFSGCISLLSVTILSNNTIFYDSVFLNDSAIEAVYTSSIEAWCGLTFNLSSSNPIEYANCLYVDGELLTELIIPNTITAINDRAFRKCTSITSLTIGENVKTIGIYAFYQCTGLTSVNFTNINKIYVTTSSDYTNGIKIDVTDQSTNITYLISTYADYYWYKE